MEEQTRLLGLGVINEAPWGTHLCQFYETKEDLIDTLTPYLKAGLENNEFCMWVTSQPLGVKDAKASLKKAVKNLDEYIDRGQIEILDYSQWYTKEREFDVDELLNGWVEKLNRALGRGFDGLRLTGNTFWLEKKDWNDFAVYEAAIDNVIGNYPIIALCSYCLDKCGPSEIIDVVKNHQSALIRRQGNWQVFENVRGKRAEESLQQRECDLAERVKELKCLYGISGLVEKPDISFQEILQGTANLIPSSWQYPEVTCTRILLEGQEYRTNNFRDAEWKLSSEIVVHSETVGALEVCYLEERPASYEGPFLKEERTLLDAVAERLGHIIERTQAQEALSKAHDDLKAHAEHMEQLNAALKVLLKQREDDKKELEENVLSNVKQMVSPYLEKLKRSGLDTTQKTLATTLESNLDNIVSPFISRLSSKFLSLTPTEIRVAGLIKEGKTNKEIAELLCLSTNTILFHRYNVRGKLGLRNKKINLRSYLLSLAK